MKKTIFTLGIAIAVLMLSSVFASATWTGFNYRYDWKGCSPEITDVFTAREMKCNVLPTRDRTVGVGMTIGQQMAMHGEARRVMMEKPSIQVKNVYRGNQPKSSTLATPVEGKMMTGKIEDVSIVRGEVRGSVTFGFGREIPIMKGEQATKCSPTKKLQPITFDRIEQRIQSSARFVEIFAKNVKIAGCSLE